MNFYYQLGFCWEHIILRSRWLSLFSWKKNQSISSFKIDLKCCHFSDLFSGYSLFSNREKKSFLKIMKWVVYVNQIVIYLLILYSLHSIYDRIFVHIYVIKFIHRAYPQQKYKVLKMNFQIYLQICCVFQTENFSLQH